MYHVWKENDNLLTVTNEYKITVEKLKRLNPDIKDWDNVKVGMEVKIK